MDAGSFYFDLEKAKSMREMNAQQVTVKMKDGSIFRGHINIGACRRLSDFFRKTDASPFVVMFDATIGEESEKGVYFINLDHVLWVKPSEPEGKPSFSGSITLTGSPE